MWTFYELLLMIGLLCYLPKALWRRRLPHRGWSMRLGRYPAQLRAQLQGRRAVWVHAVSVGEILAVQPLLAQLVEASPHEALVVSTVTPSGFKVASQQLKQQASAIYFPLDVRWCVRRAFDTLRPQILILVESEWWPGVVRMARQRHVPVIVVNGRISQRAFPRYLLVKRWLAPTLQQLDLLLMQSQTDADRAIQLGAVAERVHVVGSLKWDASLGARPSAELLRQTAMRCGLRDGDPLVVAGSTHHGEEEAVLQAFRRVRAVYGHVRLILAPRHLERLRDVEALIRQHGWQVTRLSQAAQNAWDVGLVDTFGQLPQYYGLATAVFIGGSLIPHGGQNPLEAASLGKPILFGPSMDNFEAIAHQLLAHHAARQVANAEELVRVLGELLAHPQEAQAMGARAQELTERFQGATQRTLQALQPLLAPNTKHQISITK